MNHIHHIIPRYAGGSNDPSNLLECDVETHALLHKERWVKYGDRRDYLAWKALAGEISKEEIVHQARLIGGEHGGWKSPEVQKRIGKIGLDSMKKKKKGVVHDPKHRNSWVENVRTEIKDPQGTVYRTIKEAADKYAVSHTTVGRWCKKKEGWEVLKQRTLPSKI